MFRKRPTSISAKVLTEIEESTHRSVFPQLNACMRGKVGSRGVALMLDIDSQAARTGLTTLAARAVVGILAPYSATKGAIDTLVKHFATALGPRGIRVKAISPGHRGQRHVELREDTRRPEKRVEISDPNTNGSQHAPSGSGQPAEQQSNQSFTSGGALPLITLLRFAEAVSQ
jgi:NAD(P)-dependent dehydrogenase (short-subunit alcohol dehydrogenase family)